MSVKKIRQTRKKRKGGEIKKYYFQSDQSNYNTIAGYRYRYEHLESENNEQLMTYWIKNYEVIDANYDDTFDYLQMIESILRDRGKQIKIEDGYVNLNNLTITKNISNKFRRFTRKVKNAWKYPKKKYLFGLNKSSIPYGTFKAQSPTDLSKLKTEQLMEQWVKADSMRVENDNYLDHNMYMQKIEKELKSRGKEILFHRGNPDLYYTLENR